MVGIMAGSSGGAVGYEDGDGVVQDVDGEHPLPVDAMNLDADSLLNRILKELKIMNLHLSLLTDNEIKYTEVE